MVRLGQARGRCRVDFGERASVVVAFFLLNWSDSIGGTFSQSTYQLMYG